MFHFNFQSDVVEEATREQWNSKLWFNQRAGRITASNFKAATSTNPEHPSNALVKMLCDPKAYSFTTTATK